uniref:TyrKc domain-containing protein n=1 Tax=Macrostomum lignano TaxID=282301 RepID=A0A1I8FIT2_9PLAT
RRTAPIKKRLVCVDNSEPAARRQRQRQNTASTSQASTVTASDTAQLLVPEVRVERIGASRSMWGFGSDGLGRMMRARVQQVQKSIGRFVMSFPAVPCWSGPETACRCFDCLAKVPSAACTPGSCSVGNKPKDVAVKMLKRPFLLLVELAHHGNLRDFLKIPYHNLHPGTKQMQYLPCVSGQLLLQFATDVASALDFMASIKTWPLANILVANGDNNDGSLVAKVADFGLTRNVQDKDYYRVINEGKLPVKWLALRVPAFSSVLHRIG